jgi:hypothetical protein
MDVTANYHGADVASLKIPTEKATTSATGLVTTQFANVPFSVIDKTTFTGFVQLLTMSPSVTFGLKGSSNAVAQTAVGALNLQNVGFNVDTTLSGKFIQSHFLYRLLIVSQQVLPTLVVKQMFSLSILLVVLRNTLLSLSLLSLSTLPISLLQLVISTLTLYLTNKTPLWVVSMSRTSLFLVVPRHLLHKCI